MCLGTGPCLPDFPWQSEGEELENTSNPVREREPPGDRLSWLREASLRINECLKFDDVLYGDRKFRGVGCAGKTRRPLQLRQEPTGYWPLYSLCGGARPRSGYTSTKNLI